MSHWRFSVSAGLAGAAGALGVMAFSPVGWFPLAWLGWAVLFALLCALPEKGFVFRGALLGGCFGLTHFALGVPWIYISLSDFGGLHPVLAVVATTLFCALLALFPLLTAAFFVRFRPHASLLQALFFAALWTFFEYLRGVLLSGFPWLSLGYSQAPPSPLAGWAPLVGVYGVSFLTALLAALLVVFKKASVDRRFYLFCLTCSIPLSGFLLGQIRWTVPQGKPLSVALLQGNVAQDIKWQPERLYESLTVYEDLMQQHPAALTVLPETAFPALLEQVPADFLRRFRALALAQAGDLLIGTVTEQAGHYLNIAASFGKSPLQVYAKAHLVPFGEFVPPGFRWLTDYLHIPMSDFMAGPVRQPPLRIAGVNVAVNICYEDVFGDAIATAAKDADILVNLSNTAWFGRSWAQPQHLQIAQLRALETGRPLLRATNTGMTAVITPQGRVKAVLPPFTRGGLREEIQGHVGTTPYMRWGDAAILVVVFFSCLGCLLVSRCRMTST